MSERTQQWFRWESIARLVPWVAFVAVLAWTWRAQDLLHTVPVYGDTMEAVAGVAWLDEALRAGVSPLVFPYNYFPEGWRVASHSAGMLVWVVLWPFHRLGGPAFAYNIGIILTSLLAFIGAYLLARIYFKPVLATLPALIFAFGALRWYQATNGRMQLFAGSVFLPWMLWAVERGLRSPRRRWAWLVAAAACGAAAFMMGQYFVFLGGILLAVWILFGSAGQPRPWKERLVDLAVAGSAFIAFSAPWLLVSLRETAIADPKFYGIGEVNFSGASLNSLPLPSLFHPWLGALARQVYKGEPWEQGAANLGLLMVIVAVVGFVLAFRLRAWRPILISTVVFLVLALGLTLHWNGQPVQWAALRPVNQALWTIGHALKPDFFEGTQPPAEFGDAVPLPGMVLAAIVPYLERGRMMARYALPVSLTIALLASLTLSHIRRRWLQVILGALLIFEFLPPPLDVLPFPPEPHPAFLWLREQDLGDQGIAEVFAGNPSLLVLGIHGESLLAPLLHGQASAAGAAGVVPRHTLFLNDWLMAHQHPFWHADFASILRSYRVKYLLMEMHGPLEEELWKEAQTAEGVKPLRCFSEAPSSQAWDYPICVLEVLPAKFPAFNVLFHAGWSGQEAWGIWAEGVESAAQWIATARAPQRLSVAAFPQCLPDRFQRIELEVNGAVVTSHQWQDCEPWSETLDIPAELVRVGANDLIVRADYAVPPLGGGDPRQLSAGFTKLLVEPLSKAE